MQIVRIAWTAAAAIVLMATVVQGHHSFTMFDGSGERVMTGELVRWGFNSPHTLVFIKDAAGTVWSFEGSAPSSLLARRPKMDGRTFKAGDKVTMIYCPLRDGRSGGAMGFIITADGTWYNPADGGCRLQEAEWRKWIAAGYTSREQATAAATR